MIKIDEDVDKYSITIFRIINWCDCVINIFWSISRLTQIYIILLFIIWFTEKIEFLWNYIYKRYFKFFWQRRQMHWNLIWKSPGFVPFGANLTHFGAKPTIPGLCVNSFKCRCYHTIPMLVCTFYFMLH